MVDGWKDPQSALQNGPEQPLPHTLTSTERLGSKGTCGRERTHSPKPCRLGYGDGYKPFSSAPQEPLEIAPAWPVLSPCELAREALTLTKER